MPKTPFSKYLHVTDPALRRMLTQERLAALSKHLRLAAVQQQRGGDSQQYDQKLHAGQRAIERLWRLVERRTIVPGRRKEAE